MEDAFLTYFDDFVCKAEIVAQEKEMLHKVEKHKLIYEDKLRKLEEEKAHLVAKVCGRRLATIDVNTVSNTKVK